jgi:adenylate kinase family enzyme
VRRRIQVLGASCSGKTTLAALLSERLGVPHIELDALHHGPNWEEATHEELRARVAAAVEGTDGWVADGNYLTALGPWLIDQADTVVWLDLPLRVTVARMFRRTTFRIKAGTELWGMGNRESWSNFLLKPNGLLLYSLRTHRRRRRQTAEFVDPAKLVRLRSEADVAAWLATQG